jgi:ABC-type transport system involved in cytochrome c biogenesis ATPase subunit
MANLILNSLEIRGFRGFHHLRIERLGRVNLIVGKNNVGKTSLLEALQLYMDQANPSLIWELLQIRDESTYMPTQLGRTEVRSLLSSLKYLFYGRKEIGPLLEPIMIGPVDSPASVLSLTIGWYITRTDEVGNQQVKLLQPEEYDKVEDSSPRFTVSVGEHRRSASLSPRLRTELNKVEDSCVSINAGGLDSELIEDFWSKVVLSVLEEDVLAALRIIAPGVERLSMRRDSSSRRAVVSEAVTRMQSVSVPIVKVTDIDEPIPLRSLGDGMQRMLGMALALANAKDGMLLIDEFESGLHYSVQPDLWRLIFQLAYKLNVQVFATTHSWDCIDAFQKAAQGDNQEEGMLIRLEDRNEEIVATLFDERRLGIATREQIEVR